jgi:anti-sigma B factor antagonist
MGDRAFTPGTGVESRVETETLSDDVVVLAVHGDVDLHFAPQLRDTLDGVIDHGPARVLVDLSDTAFIDSMALGVLLAGTKRMRADGNRLELVVPNPDLRRIFEITMLDRVLLIHPSLEPAIADGAGEAA